MKQPVGIKLISALVIGLFSGYAAASGFQLQNQAGSGNGNAFAGAAAAAEDSSTVFFNPAGMTNLPEGQNVSLSGTLLNRSIKFHDTGSTTTPGFGFGSSFPLPSGNGGDAGGLALLPAGYWSYSIAPNWRIGVGVGPTFGNTTEYGFDFMGRNAGYYFEMEQININPSVAYKLNEMVSLGVGVNLAHNTSHFKQGNPLVMPLAGYQPNNYLEVKAKDWAYGYNLGATFQISPNTRIGLSYRSTLTFNLEGHESWGATAPGALGGLIPPLVDADIKGTLKTPSNYSLAAEHKLNDKWEFLGDVTWTNWSVLSTLFVNNQQTGAPLQKLPYNFRDTWRIGLGGNYQYDAAWKLRFGVAYDKTPVGSAADRTMTLPDASRTWLSFGAKYALSPASSLDFGYTHIFFADAPTARAVTTGYPTTPDVTRQTIRGDFTTTADILSLQYNHTF